MAAYTASVMVRTDETACSTSTSAAARAIAGPITSGPSGLRTATVIALAGLPRNCMNISGSAGASSRMWWMSPTTPTTVSQGPALRGSRVAPRMRRPIGSSPGQKSS